MRKMCKCDSVRCSVGVGCFCRLEAVENGNSCKEVAEVLTENLECFGDLCLDGAFRQSELFGNVVVADIFETAHFEYASALRRQLVDGMRKAGFEFALCHHLLNVVGRSVERRYGFLCVIVVDLAVFEFVETVVVDALIEKRAYRCHVELLTLFVDADKERLHDVDCRLFVSEYLVCIDRELCEVSVEERAECSFAVVGCKPIKKLYVCCLLHSAKIEKNMVKTI